MWQHTVEDIVDRHRADQTPGVVGHRQCDHVVGGEATCDLAIGCAGLDRIPIVVDATPDRLRGRLSQQTLDANDTDETTSRRLERRLANEYLGRERYGEVRVAKVRKRLRDGGVRCEDDRLRRHQSSGRVWLVEQQPAYALRLLRIHCGEQFLLLAAGHLAQQVGGIVRLHLVQHASDAFQVEALDQAYLLVLWQLLEQVGQALVLERLCQQPAAVERQAADLAGHLGRVQAAEIRRFTINTTLLGEEVACLAPVDHLRCALEAGHPPSSAQGHRRHLPRERLGCSLKPEIDDSAAAEAPAEELARGEPLAGSELELPEIDRAAAEPHAAGVDLADTAGADEHAATLHSTDDEAVHAWWASAHIEHHVDHMANIGSIGCHEWETCHSRYVDDPLGHASNPRPTARAVKLCNRPRRKEMPTTFATATELTPEELAAAPVRYPSPRQLARPLRVHGNKAADGARSLGLLTVGDLLEHLPRDRREARAVAELIAGETATIVVEVRRIASRAVRRRGMRPLVEATVADPSGTLRVTFFNQPWLVDRYPVGTRLILHGKAEGRGRFTVQGHAPTDQHPGQSGSETSGPGVAHYPATEGLSSTQILALVHEHAANFDDALEALPATTRIRERLLDRPGALRAAHFPVGSDDQEEARRRLAFDELLFAQIALQRRRRNRQANALAPSFAGPRELTARWLEHELPFELTGDQRAALDVIDEDVARPEPMQRLLMGEVGSGKTVVALYAMLRAVEHGFQAAMMAPTETLAEQHFATLQKLLGVEPVRAGLLTGSTPAQRRSDLLGKLASGELSLIVGTHALIEDAVEFASLGLVVVDEQHRFGVAQRAALAATGAGRAAHELHMTATPIPRTLALSHYGDLDMTVLRGLPRGRQPIATYVCASDAERERAYARIRQEVDAGRQAFVVCPLVEESEALQARAATSEYERLRTGPFAAYDVILMHGQMRPAEKQDAMARFASGEAQVLVATTVIEVGIDVPNATVMLVEDADRYGISQLHQLRGRIGRGGHASLCLLFGRRDSRRLQALARESDGFELAEVDLRLRGQGELAGSRQSGHDADYKFAQLPQDAELLERAVRYACSVLDSDPALEQPEHALMAAILPRILV